MSEFKDTDVECYITKLPELPTLVSVDENNIQNIVEWKDTETAGKLKWSKGKLKKGMTLQAYFNVARRSLYQLLYDKIDNWLNPQVMFSD